MTQGGVNYWCHIRQWESVSLIVFRLVEHALPRNNEVNGLKMSNNNSHHNSDTKKIKLKKMTQCTALRGKLEAAISPRMHFPKYGNRKKASQQSMSKDQIEIVPFRQGPLPGP